MLSRLLLDTTSMLACMLPSSDCAGARCCLRHLWEEAGPRTRAWARVCPRAHVWTFCVCACARVRTNSGHACMTGMMYTYKHMCTMFCMQIAQHVERMHVHACTHVPRTRAYL